MSVAVVMPAFNESEGIREFVLEIIDAFEKDLVSIVVVDDASEDETVEVLQDLAREGAPVVVRCNLRNVGHGPSTLLALKAGLETGVSTIVAVDGDGQFLGRDVARLANLLELHQPDVIEGVRTGRQDPIYRRLVSRVTQGLVWRACGSAPCDANTPLRAYSRRRLEFLLDELPEDAMTPNLLISVQARRSAWNVMEVEVASLERRGASSVGTTWGANRLTLPSLRFITFCWNAFAQWIRFQSRRSQN